MARGVTDAYDTIQVTHKTNGVADGISTCAFKSYEQGRQKFQSDEVDVIWLDEEPNMDIYQECLARISASDGMVYITFTPLLSRSSVVLRFINEKSVDRDYVRMTIDDALHFTPEMKRKTIEGYDKSERDARVKGNPASRSGKIFELAEKSVSELALHNIPSYWAKIWGIDFGIGHPFAAALLLWDKDNDVIHVHHVIKMADGLPINHAAAMVIGADVPGCVAARWCGARKSSAQPLADIRKKGCACCRTPTTWPDGEGIRLKPASSPYRSGRKTGN